MAHTYFLMAVGNKCRAARAEVALDWFSEWVLLVSATSLQGGGNYGPSHNLPFARVALTWFGWNEPAVSLQNFGRGDRALLIPEGFWSVDTNISWGNGGFCPALEPIEQFLRVIFVRMLAPRRGRRWSSFIEPLK
jgi:hypothetical protein